MKKIFVLIIGLAMALAMSMAPAQATVGWGSPWDSFKQLDCGSAPQTGHLAVNVGSDGRFYVEGDLNDAGSGAPHNWNWRMLHNGDVSYRGDGTSGSFTRHETMVNLSGPDTIKFAVDNDSGTIHCQATLYF